MTELILRKADLNDLNEIEQIILDAKERLKIAGLDQWQGAYPNKDSIKEDIDNGYGYVLTHEHDISAYVACLYGEMPNYSLITDGKWINDNKEYISIHRFAVAQKYLGQGIGSKFLKEIVLSYQSKGISDFRIDTHPQNKGMQKVITKNNFTYCGKVDADGERYAYQLLEN